METVIFFLLTCCYGHVIVVFGTVTLTLVRDDRELKKVFFKVNQCDGWNWCCSLMVFTVSLEPDTIVCCWHLWPLQKKTGQVYRCSAHVDHIVVSLERELLYSVIVVCWDRERYCRLSQTIVELLSVLSSSVPLDSSPPTLFSHTTRQTAQRRRAVGGTKDIRHWWVSENEVELWPKRCLDISNDDISKVIDVLPRATSVEVAKNNCWPIPTFQCTGTSSAASCRRYDTYGAAPS